MLRIFRTFESIFCVIYEEESAVLSEKRTKQVHAVGLSLVAIAMALGITSAVFSLVIRVMCEYGMRIFFSTPNKFE